MTELQFPLTVTFYPIANSFRHPKVIMAIVVGSGENPPTFWKECKWMGQACDHLVEFLRETTHLSQDPLPPTVEGPKVVMLISPEILDLTQPPKVLCEVVEDNYHYALFPKFSEDLDSLRSKLVNDMFGL